MFKKFNKMLYLFVDFTKVEIILRALHEEASPRGVYSKLRGSEKK